MKHIIVSIIFFSLLQNFLFSQNPLVAYKLESKWIVLDEEGKEVLSTSEFDEIYGYSEGYFLVSRIEKGTERYYYLRKDGKKVIESDAMSAGLFYDGLARVTFFTDPMGVTMKIGYIDTTGNLTIEPKYIDALDFKDGMAWAMSNDERGYINTKGKFVLKLNDNQKFVGQNFSDGYAAIHNEEGIYGYFDLKGNQVIDFKYQDAGFFKDGMARVNKDLVYGFIGEKGELIIPHQFEYAMDFHSGVAFAGTYDVNRQPVWGVIDLKGNKLVEFQYKAVRDFSEGIATVFDVDAWYFIDPYGSRIIDKAFSTAGRFRNGLAWASSIEEGKHGFIDYFGNFVVELPKAEKFIDLRFNRPFAQL